MFRHKQVMELVTPERNWVLSAPSKDDRQIWFQRLCNLIGKDGLKKCYRLNPIYNNYSFQYNEKTNSWIQRYFALTPKHLYFFDDAASCDQAAANGYFDKAKFHIGISGYVSGFIPLNNPKFTIWNKEQCKVYNKQHLFEIDTSFSKIIMSATHNSELEEWRKAFVQIESMQNDDDEKEIISQDAFSEDILQSLRESTKKGKKSKKPMHSSSNSMTLSMVTHFPGFIKKDKKKKIPIIKDEEEVKDGYNEETKLPAPEPRKKMKSNDKIQGNMSKKRKKKKSKKTKDRNKNPSFRVKKIGIGGAGNAGKVDPFRRSKTDRTRNQRDRTKSRSLNEAMFNDLVASTLPAKHNAFLGASSIANSYNPNRDTHYLPNIGGSNMDFKFDQSPKLQSSYSMGMNMKSSPKLVSTGMILKSSPNLHSAGITMNGNIRKSLSSGYGNGDNNGFYTTNRPIPMISPTPSRHGSFDSMANNVHSTRLRPESFLSVTYNAGTRTSVSKSYQTDDEISVISDHDQIGKQISMLSTKADDKIVGELMELGFVSKELCEKAAMATNNRSTHEASQYL